jgi:hypothetical protein
MPQIGVHARFRILKSHRNDVSRMPGIASVVEDVGGEPQREDGAVQLIQVAMVALKAYTIKPDGSGVQRLTHTRGNDAHGIWSPDGEWIVFSSSRLGWKDEALASDYGPQLYGELFAMRADGSGVRQLTDNQWEDALPAFQPKPK